MCMKGGGGGEREKERGGGEREREREREREMVCVYGEGISNEVCISHTNTLYSTCT